MPPFAIDVHMHLGEVSGFHPRFNSPEEMLYLMDRIQTQVGLFVPMGLLTAQFDLGYREACEVLDRHPERFRAYMVFDPNWPDESMRYLTQYHNHPGFVGIKIHPTVHGVDPSDPRYRDFWAFADEHACVVLTHTWSPDPAKPTQDLATPDRFAGILEKHTRLQLILGHCGGRDVGRRLAVEMMQHFPTCWADLSGDDFPFGELEWLAARIGAHRLLYGTDAIWIEPRYSFARVLKAGLSPADRLRIFRENALTLFGSRITALAPV